jgi:hypothetical protein
MARPQRLEQLIHAARCVELRIGVEVLCEDADGLAIEGQGHIRIASYAVGAQHVRPL